MMAIGTDEPYSSSGFGAVGPFVAKDSTRHESHRQMTGLFQNVDVDESIRRDEDTDRRRDMCVEIDWDEKIVERRELLDQECCDFIKATAKQLLQRDNNGDSRRDRDLLREKAYEAWCKACFIPDELKDCIEAEKNAATERWLDRIGMLNQQRAKAAGSSLNSIVTDWAAYDLRLLEAELTGIVGKYKADGIRFRNEALRDAFNMYETVAIDLQDRSAARGINLLTVLRGSKDDFMRDHNHDEKQTTDDDEVTNVDISQQLDRDTTTIAIEGKWYQNITQSTEGAGQFQDQQDVINAAVDTLTTLASGGVGG